MSNQASSLSEQMAKLQKSMQRREKRRGRERTDRMERSEYDGGESNVNGEGVGGLKRQRNATGGVQWGSAAAAVAASSLLGLPTLIHCDFCQVTFSNQAEMQQHLHGPVHAKTVQRVQANQLRRERLGKNRDVAESAVAAAAWQAQQGIIHKPTQAVSSIGVSQRPRASNKDEVGVGTNAYEQQRPGQHRFPRLPDKNAVVAANLLSHEELLQQARGHEAEEMHIGGWVPPSIPVAAPAQGDGTIGAVAPQSTYMIAEQNQRQQLDTTREVATLAKSLARHPNDLTSSGNKQSNDSSSTRAAFCKQSLTSCEEGKQGQLVANGMDEELAKDDSDTGSGSELSEGCRGQVSFFTF